MRQSAMMQLLSVMVTSSEGGSANSRGLRPIPSAITIREGTGVMVVSTTGDVGGQVRTRVKREPEHAGARTASSGDRQAPA